jgi:hypothetical protein
MPSHARPQLRPIGCVEELFAVVSEFSKLPQLRDELVVGILTRASRYSQGGTRNTRVGDRVSSEERTALEQIAEALGTQTPGAPEAPG